jgi:hypothetical protein
MLHPRHAIRNAIVSLLRDPLPDTTPPVYRTSCNSKVFPSRTTPLPVKRLPAILVYTASDVPDASYPRNDEGPTRRLLEAVIEVAAIGEDADDQIDTICLQVEAALLERDNLGGVCERALLGGTDIELAGDGEADIVAARISVNVAYWSDVPVADGSTPEEVYGSWVPLIGPANLPLYQRIDNGQLPEIE